MAFVNCAFLCIFAIAFLMVVGGHSNGCGCRRKHKRKCPEASTPSLSSSSTAAPMCNSTECAEMSTSNCYCIHDDDAHTSASYSVPESGDCQKLQNCSVCYKIGRICACIDGNERCECRIADPGPPPKPHSICPLTSSSSRPSTITPHYTRKGACTCIQDNEEHTTHTYEVPQNGLCEGVQPCSICYCIIESCPCNPADPSCVCKPVSSPGPPPPPHSICPLNSTTTTIMPTVAAD